MQKSQEGEELQVTKETRPRCPEDFRSSHLQYKRTKSLQTCAQQHAKECTGIPAATSPVPPGASSPAPPIGYILCVFWLHLKYICFSVPGWYQ